MISITNVLSQHSNFSNVQLAAKTNTYSKNQLTEGSFLFRQQGVAVAPSGAIALPYAVGGSLNQG